MILLDRHAYFWFVLDDPHLPARVKALIENDRDVFVSSISFWEMAIKSSKGKMELPSDIDVMMRTCEKMGISILQIQGTHLRVLQTLPWIHKDPFDRLLIAQAKAENMILVTADENIAKYDVSTYWR